MPEFNVTRDMPKRPFFTKGGCVDREIEKSFVTNTSLHPFILTNHGYIRDNDTVTIEEIRVGDISTRKFKIKKKRKWFTLDRGCKDMR